MVGMLWIRSMRKFLASLGFSVAAAGIPLVVLGAFHEFGPPGRSDLAPGRPGLFGSPLLTPSVSPSAFPPGRGRGLLREERHAGRLERVIGIVNGMTNKLQNLYDQLGRHLVNVERRIQALVAAGHTISVEEELAAARTKVAETQGRITNLLTTLQGLPDAERPQTVLRGTIRPEIQQIRTDLRAVRAAFQALRLAIRNDVRNRPSPSPSVPPTATPTASPAVIPSPSPSPSLIPSLIP